MQSKWEHQWKSYMEYSSTTICWNKCLGKPFHHGPAKNCIFNIQGSRKMDKEQFMLASGKADKECINVPV